jgi:putative heme-binding domain-containing protein
MTKQPSKASVLVLGVVVLWATGSVLWVTGSSLHGQTSAHDQIGQYGRSDVVKGARVYQERCAACHGESGDAVGSVNLKSGQFKTVVTDRDLARVVTTGIPDRGMPGFKLDVAEMAGIIAYLRTMNTFDRSSIVVGDALRGQAIVEGKGACLTCHRIRGRGSRVAPDLSDIGAIRSAGSLERSLTNPSSQMMPINRPVRAMTGDRQVITGRRLNEDTYTVQLMTDTEQLVSLQKSELRSYSILTTSTMPSYKDELGANELADVLAYLLSLKEP